MNELDATSSVMLFLFFLVPSLFDGETNKIDKETDYFGEPKIKEQTTLDKFKFPTFRNLIQYL